MVAENDNIIPFRKRQTQHKPARANCLDSMVADLFYRLESQRHGPLTHVVEPLMEEAHARRPAPAKGELVRRVLQRAKDKRNSRQPR